MMPAGLSPAGRRLAWRIIAAAVLLMLLLLTDGRPWTLFASGEFSSDFYDAQARSLAHGKLAVDPEVASFEGIVQGDETHLYYGIFLALARVPVTLVTHSLSGQLARLSILVAYALALVVSVHLAHAGQQLVCRESDDRDRWRIAVLLLAVAASPALFTFGWITVYHETEMWAFTLALAALACALRVLTTPSRRWAYGAAAAASLCTTTRASVGVAVTGAVLVALVVAYRSSIRQLAGPALAAVAGCVVHGIVNTVRFGGPWNIPVLDQVQTKDPARSRWFAEHESFFAAEFVPSTLLQYLRPDAVRFERIVPFVRYGPPAVELNGVDFESNTPTTSLTVGATLLVILAVAGVVWAVRERRFALLGMIAATAVAGVPTLMIGFTANRYLIDFMPALVLAAAVAVWLTPPARVPVKAFVVALVAWGVIVNVALGVWSGRAIDTGFVEGRFRLDDRFFDGSSPGVIRAADVTDRTAFGTIAVDAEAGRCLGVYVVDGRGVSTLERSAGDHMVAGTSPRGGMRLIDNGDWTLDLQADGDIFYTRDDRRKVITTVESSRGRSVDYSIVADPNTREHYGVVDGTLFYLPTTVLEGPPLDTADDQTGPLCSLMTDRLGGDD
jgi:hypothetical protein